MHNELQSPSHRLLPDIFRQKLARTRKLKRVWVYPNRDTTNKTKAQRNNAPVSSCADGC